MNAGCYPVMQRFPLIAQNSCCRLVGSVLLTGCILFIGCRSADIQPPDLDAAIPGQYGPSTTESQWVARLADPQLQALVEEAWQRNPGIRQMAAQLEAARAEARLAGVALQPQLSAGIEASRQDTSIAENFRIRESRYTLSGQASWEIDLWGRLRSQRDAATAQLEATKADYEAARLALAANAVVIWIDLTELSAQIKLAERNRNKIENRESIVYQRFNAGLETSLELRMARVASAAASNRIQQLERQRDGLQRSLETLLGRYPSASLAAADELPPLPPPPEPGLPSELMERRPDLLAAAARFEAASHSYESARRARLPSLRLTGSAGTSSGQLSDLLQSDAFVWNLAASLTAPLWDGGRIAAEGDLARARIQQAAENYAETALQAFREVETALAALDRLARQEAAMRVAAEESASAEELAVDRYQRGLIPFSRLLEIQQQSIEYQGLLLGIRSDRLKNHIDILLALGGDFLPAP